MKNTGNSWEVTREEAIEKVGLEAVEKVEATNCEWSSGGGQSFGEHDTIQTWQAYLPIKNNDKYDGIYAVYFVEDSAFIGADGNLIEDLSNIDWQISHYIING